MVQTKDTSSYLILAIALVVVAAISIWFIVSSEFGGRAKKSSIKTEEEIQYSVEEEEFSSLANEEELPSLEEGDQAPDFKLESIEGEFISLGNLKGRSFLLVFFNSQCGWTKKEMPDLVELAKQGKEIIAISVWGEKKGELIKFAQELEIDFPILIDKNDEIAGKYFIKGTPTNFLIDKNGKIVEKHRGYAPRVELERILGL